MSKRVTKRTAVETKGRRKAALVTKKVKKKSLEELLIQHGSTPERLALLELADEFILLRGEVTGSSKSLHVLMLDLDRKFSEAIGAHVEQAIRQKVNERIDLGVEKAQRALESRVWTFVNENFEPLIRKKKLDDLLPHDEQNAQQIRGPQSFAPEPTRDTSEAARLQACDCGVNEGGKAIDADPTHHATSCKLRPENWP